MIAKWIWIICLVFIAVKGEFRGREHPLYEDDSNNEPEITPVVINHAQFKDLPLPFSASQYDISVNTQDPQAQSLCQVGIAHATRVEEVYRLDHLRIGQNSMGNFQAKKMFHSIAELKAAERLRDVADQNGRFYCLFDIGVVRIYEFNNGLIFMVESILLPEGSSYENIEFVTENYIKYLLVVGGSKILSINLQSIRKVPVPLSNYLAPGEQLESALVEGDLLIINLGIKGVNEYQISLAQSLLTPLNNYVVQGYFSDNSKIKLFVTESYIFAGRHLFIDPEEGIWSIPVSASKSQTVNATRIVSSRYCRRFNSFSNTLGVFCGSMTLIDSDFNVIKGRKLPFRPTGTTRLGQSIMVHSLNKFAIVACLKTIPTKQNPTPSCARLQILEEGSLPLQALYVGFTTNGKLMSVNDVSISSFLIFQRQYKLSCGSQQTSQPLKEWSTLVNVTGRSVCRGKQLKIYLIGDVSNCTEQFVFDVSVSHQQGGFKGRHVVMIVLIVLLQFVVLGCLLYMHKKGFRFGDSSSTLVEERQHESKSEACLDEVSRIQQKKTDAFQISIA